MWQGPNCLSVFALLRSIALPGHRQGRHVSPSSAGQVWIRITLKRNDRFFREIQSSKTASNIDYGVGCFRELQTFVGQISRLRKLQKRSDTSTKYGAVQQPYTSSEQSINRSRWCERRRTSRVTLDFSARCNIYISRLCYDVSVRLSVRLSVCLWRKCIGAL